MAGRLHQLFLCLLVHTNYPCKQRFKFETDCSILCLVWSQELRENISPIITPNEKEKTVFRRLLGDCKIMTRKKLLIGHLFHQAWLIYLSVIPVVCLLLSLHYPYVVCLYRYRYTVKAVISPRGAYSILGTPEGGLLERGAYSKS